MGGGPNTSSRRSFLAGGLSAALSGLAFASHGHAAALDEADTSTQTRDDAIAGLPLAELSAESRRKLMSVCERPTLFRRLPQKSFTCEADLHRFLIRNPEVVVNIWQLMQIASMTAERTGPYTWKGSDGAGTVCDVELIYGNENLHVLYGDGYYEGTLLMKKVTGRAVLVLKSGYAAAPDRRAQVANRLDLFLQIDNLAADVVTRTLSPWVGKVADANFHESCNFASKLSLTAEQNGPGVQRLAERLTQVTPAVRDEFSRVAASVPQRTAARPATATAAARR